MYAPFRSVALALAGAVIMVATAGAQQAPTSPIGAWALAPQQGEVIADAIERGTADMNFVTRPIARRRLRTTNNAYATIRIRQDGSSITTVLDGRRLTLQVTIRSARLPAPIVYRLAYDAAS